MKEQNPDREILEELARKWLDGSITDQEQKQFDDWYNSHDDELLELPADYALNANQIRERMYARIKEGIEEGNKEQKAVIYRLPRIWRRILTAAIFLFISALAVWFYVYEHGLEATVPIAQAPYIAPGGNKAVLTLSDGKKINLDDSSEGLIAKQGSVDIQKARNGLISYQANSYFNVSEIAYNTVETPMGGQYKVALSDGSMVWLNAGSSLQYPTTFNGKNRIVKLIGEGYFEVAKDKSHPFLVETRNQQVEVLGTHFNINAYNDEPKISTTLLEGSVRVHSANNEAVLKPGQQSSLTPAGILVTDANTYIATAWKDGQMAFKQTDIKTVLRQIARWYNIEIVYDGAIPTYTISGEVSRQSDLSAMLKILSLSDVHYMQQGRKLIIRP